MKHYLSTGIPLLGALLAMNGHLSVANSLYELDKVVVTSTREEKPLSELAESVGVLTQQDIQNISPSHPSEVLNRSAGVYINNLGGEGHMTAIRQPISTSAVYLFLEDGVPTRPTGFFNHNGLYEVNIPQSERLEVTKGPGSALYGSGAMGGVINSISAKVSKQPHTKIDTEVGANEWQRILLSSSRPLSAHSGAGIQANLTKNVGFRDDADYERKNLNMRFNYQLQKNVSAKNTLSFTEVDQSGVSSLEYYDYKNDVSKNKYQADVGARNIEALRVTSEININTQQGDLFTFTPFYRHNQSTMMPSWMVSYDANVRDTQFESFGLLSKWRRQFNNGGQIISGLDVDHTPSRFQEFDVAKADIVSDGDIITGFTKSDDLNYKYKATQTSISPYIHFENQLTSNIRLSAGVRYDVFKVDYTDQLDAPVDTDHLRPESQSVNYAHLSPKGALVYNINDRHDVYANYRHAFRAPSVGKLFRSGKNTNTADLKPVNTDSVELGLRGLIAQAMSYELAVYHMEKTNDIVSVVNSDDDRVSLNAGKSIHQGVELSLSGNLSEDFSFSTALSVSEQTYGKFEYLYSCFSCDPRVVNQVLNFDGNYVGKAPDSLGNIALRYEPVKVYGLMVELELEHVGEYYTDETNTNKYAGHQVVNLRSNYQVNTQLQVYGRLQNLADERYSTYTSNQVGSDKIEYRPGAPLSLFAGLRYSF